MWGFDHYLRNDSSKEDGDEGPRVISSGVDGYVQGTQPVTSVEWGGYPSCHRNGMLDGNTDQHSSSEWERADRLRHGSALFCFQLQSIGVCDRHDRALETWNRLSLRARRTWERMAQVLKRRRRGRGVGDCDFVYLTSTFVPPPEKKTSDEAPLPQEQDQEQEQEKEPESESGSTHSRRYRPWSSSRGVLTAKERRVIQRGVREAKDYDFSWLMSDEKKESDSNSESESEPESDPVGMPDELIRDQVPETIWGSHDSTSGLPSDVPILGERELVRQLEVERNLRSASNPRLRGQSTLEEAKTFISKLRKVMEDRGTGVQVQDPLTYVQLQRELLLRDYYRLPVTVIPSESVCEWAVQNGLFLPFAPLQERTRNGCLVFHYYSMDTRVEEPSKSSPEGHCEVETWSTDEIRWKGVYRPYCNRSSNCTPVKQSRNRVHDHVHYHWNRESDRFNRVAAARLDRQRAENQKMRAVRFLASRMAGLSRKAFLEHLSLVESGEQPEPEGSSV